MKLFASLKTSLVIWAWNHTPNCAEMARLTSQSFEQPLPLGLRLKMRLHHVICVWCRRYAKQLNWLHAAAPRLDDRAPLPTVRGLSPEAKRRIAHRLRSG